MSHHQTPRKKRVTKPTRKVVVESSVVSELENAYQNMRAEEPEVAPQVLEPEPVPEPEVETEIVEVEEVDEVGGDDEKETKKQRKKIGKDELVERLSQLIEDTAAELQNVKTSTSKMVHPKFVRAQLKELKSIRAATLRLLKTKKPRPRNNVASGFLKPMGVSKDLAKFANWDPNDPKSRVDVTRYICNYIKENNLQNPDKRKEIIPDKRLKALLGHDENDGPLTYPSIQKRIQQHFIKAAAE